MMWLGLGLFASILFGTLCFLNLHVYFLHQIREVFLSLFFQINFQFLALSLLLLAPLWCKCSTSWSCPRGCLYCSQFLDSFFFLLYCVVVLCFTYVPNHCFDSQLHPLHCCFPVSCSLFQLFFVSDWIFFMLLRSSLSSLSILISSVSNSVSDTLFISILFSIFLEFWSVASSGPCFFVSSFWQPPCVCSYVLGRVAMTSCLSRVS